MMLLVDVSWAKRIWALPLLTLQEMIALAKQKPKPFEVILVWKLSRFARNREDSILYKSLLRKRGIQSDITWASVPGCEEANW